MLILGPLHLVRGGKGGYVPYYPDLKVVGWKSNYKSVQRMLNWLKKEKLEDDVVQTYLDTIHIICQQLNRDPDAVISLARENSFTVTDALSEAMRNAGANDNELNIRLAQTITFLAENGAW